MRVCGVICEYNPFHSGHAHMLAEAREITGADVMLCLMSGEFTQRGEPTVCDKWTRAKMALMSGADIVAELPFVYAAASAERFAHGAVRILNALHIDTLAFGAECADISRLKEAAHIMNLEPERFKRILTSALSKGKSYAHARRTAFRETAPDLSDIVEGSNNVLAIEYLRAIEATGNSIAAEPILRTGSAHDGEWLYGGHPSASAVRSALEKNSPADRRRVCTEGGVPLTIDPVRWKPGLFTLAAAKLRTATPRELEQLADMEPGLTSRLLRSGRNAGSWDELVQSASSRRHPPSRIRRILLYAITGVMRYTTLCTDDSQLYAHVLGIREGFGSRMGEIRSRADIPVSPSPRDFSDSCLLRFDLTASDMYGLLMNPVRPSGADFRTKLQVVASLPAQAPRESAAGPVWRQPRRSQ